jgi:uncharacterized membrane protein YidH (DUF202 family)
MMTEAMGRAQRSRRGLAWACLAACLLSSAAGYAYGLAGGKTFDPFLLIMLQFPVIGALVANRRPGNAVGWILLGVGLGWSLPALLSIYGDYGLAHPGTLPGPEIALALNEPSWVPPIVLMGTFLILLFPDGHLPSPRWRKVAWLSAVTLVVVYIVNLIAPGRLTESGYPEIENPLGMEFIRPLFGVLSLSLALIPVCFVACATALVERFRRSQGHERLQLKWLATAGAMVAGGFVVMMALILPFIVLDREPPGWIQVVQQFLSPLFVLIPIAIGVAILRHRLYDIDLIINRTLVYALLTAALTIAYLLMVTLLQNALRPFTGQSELAVAGSTLAVAAMFRPLRVRIQAFIDRRFYRTKYDAAHTLESFSARLRNEIDIDALSSELVALVAKVMEPKHVSLWLRESSVE